MGRLSWISSGSESLEKHLLLLVVNVVYSYDSGWISPGNSKTVTTFLSVLNLMTLLLYSQFSQRELILWCH